MMAIVVFSPTCPSRHNEQVYHSHAGMLDGLSRDLICHPTFSWQYDDVVQHPVTSMLDGISLDLIWHPTFSWQHDIGCSLLFLVCWPLCQYVWHSLWHSFLSMLIPLTYLPNMRYRNTITTHHSDDQYAGWNVNFHWHSNPHVGVVPCCSLISTDWLRTTQVLWDKVTKTNKYSTGGGKITTSEKQM